MNTESDKEARLEEVDRLKAKMLKRSYYVMFRKVVDPSKIQSVLLEHYHWMIEREKEGVIFASGPLFNDDDQKGVGMTVLRADSFEQARAIGAQDPFCASGGCEFEVKRWQVNEGRISISVDFSDQTYAID